MTTRQRETIYRNGNTLHRPGCGAIRWSPKARPWRWWTELGLGWAWEAMLSEYVWLRPCRICKPSGFVDESVSE